MTTIREGGCLCGGVRYRVTGSLRPVVACYCRQCQRTSGNFVAATAVSRAAFALTAEETLAWYQSSPDAQRAFCARCGGNLFWERDGEARISIFAGTLDDSAGLETVRHIHVATKGCFHQIPPGAETFPGPSDGLV